MKNNFSVLSLVVLSSIFLSACGITETSSKYNVYFFTANQNATIVDTIFDQEVGTLIEKPEDPTRSGFDFEGWYLNVGLTEAWDFDTDLMPSESIVLYAKWTSGIKDITYHLNGGTMTTDNYPTQFSPGQNVVLPVARRVGFTFRGWFLYDQNFELYPFSEGTKPGDRPVVSISSASFEDIVLFAHWQTIRVNISFRANHPGGTSVVANPGTISFAYGAVIRYGVNFPADFGTRSGFIFMGWNSRADGTGDWYLNDTVFIRTSPLTLHGQWQPVV